MQNNILIKKKKNHCDELHKIPPEDLFSRIKTSDKVLRKTSQVMLRQSKWNWSSYLSDDFLVSSFCTLNSIITV